MLAAVLATATPAWAGPAGVPTPRPSRTSKRVVLDRVVAVVNDEIVLGSDLARKTDRHPLLAEAMSRLPANATAVIMLTEVVFASVSALLLGAGTFTPALALGGALIVGAAVLAAWHP